VAPLFTASWAGLFLQLLVIRWLGTEIPFLRSLENLLLVACFMGLSAGSLTTDVRPRGSVNQVLFGLLALVALITLGPVGWINAQFAELYNSLIEGASTSLVSPPMLARVLMMYVMLALIVFIFLPVGRVVARLMQAESRAIPAYSVNLAGSLVGIWMFAALGVARLGPKVWLGLGVVGLALLARQLGELRKLTGALLLVLLAAILLVDRPAPRVVSITWSPYQKLTLAKENNKFFVGEYIIWLGTTAFQGMLDLRHESTRKDPERFQREFEDYSQYDLPARFHPGPKKALIVGAGSGNDVAGLLRAGLQEVVAVEIDPAIIAFGRKYHPEHPYDDPRVRVVNDDARSFMASCQEKFDLICFGLLDAHTGVGMVNTRLDYYVYTRESLQRAKELLNPGGVVALDFEPALRPFIPDRLRVTLTEVFGHAPLYFRIPLTGFGWGGVMFIASLDPEMPAQQMAKDEYLAKLVAALQNRYQVPQGGWQRVATDDWPYLYLSAPQFPALYLTLLGLPVLLGITLGARRSLAILHGWTLTSTHFFLLGAAFLLLETQNLSKACVLFGSTWWVNVVVITGILGLILLANLVAATFPNLPMPPVYALLVLSSFGLYGLQVSQYSGSSLAVRVLLMAVVTSLPIFFAGLVFIRSFARVEHRDAALGANLFGALIGGLLQAFSFILGLRALMLLVGTLYLLALFCRPRR